MKKEEQEIKEEILEAAYKLFFRFGLKSVTMDDIAKEMSVSKKTLYQYFKDKNDVIETALTKHIGQEVHCFDKLKKDSIDSIELIHKISRHIRSSLGNINSALLHDLEKYHKKAWKKFKEFKRNYIYKWMEETLEEGKAEGHFRSEINSEILANLRILEIEMSFDANAFDFQKYDLATVQGQLFDHFIYGILTEKGLKLYQDYQKETIHEN